MSLLRTLILMICVLGAFSAQATQRTPTVITNEITSTLPTNSNGSISASALRAVLYDIVDSYADRQCTQWPALTGVVTTTSGCVTSFATSSPIWVGATGHIYCVSSTFCTWVAITGTGNVVRATSPTIVTPILQGYSIAQMAVSLTAPVIASGFCTSPAIAASNGTAAFEITIGTGCAASTGVLTMPTATNGWTCNLTEVTHNSSYVLSTSATSITSVTVAAYARTTGLASNWTAGAKVVGSCTAY